MGSSWPEHLSDGRKTAIEQLIRGREFTNQLQEIINLQHSYNYVADDPGTTSTSAEDLVVRILESLNLTLSILLTPPTDHFDAIKSKDSSRSCKTSSAFKDRRGCYKKRRTSETWKRESSSLIDDGHAWRKYGQKAIQDAKHPRNYFRCTHRFDQSCPATKHVQKIQDAPPRYLTTYYARHSCNNSLKPLPIIIDPPDHHNDSSFLLNFQSKTPIRNNKYASLFLQSPIPPTDLEIEGELSSICPKNLSPSDYFMAPADLSSFEDLSPASEPGDVISPGGYSSIASNCSLEMESIVGCVDFDDVLQFEFS